VLSKESTGQAQLLQDQERLAAIAVDSDRVPIVRGVRSADRAPLHVRARPYSRSPEAANVESMRQLLLLLTLSCVGCGTSQWHQRQREYVLREDAEGLEHLLSRARYELQCTSAKLEVLERYEKLATLVGAQGCGRGATYSRRLRYSRSLHGRTPENTKWELEGITQFSEPAPKPAGE
jgi:hypothetical protein